MPGKNLLFFVTEDWYFVSHRMSLAMEAKKRGYKVTLVTRIRNHGKDISDRGIRLINLDIERHGKNIIREIKTLFKIYTVYKEESADILHHVSLKPVIYGTICGILTKKNTIVNTLPGMGYLFESAGYIQRLFSRLILTVFKLLFRSRNTALIVQNRENYELFINNKILDRSRIYLIRGSGIDIGGYYCSKHASNDTHKILFASRLLWQKGIRDFVDAAKILEKQNENIMFVVAGSPDEANPNSVDVGILKQWHDSGLIEWYGYRNDMPDVMAESSVVCLPTYYGEGLPKVLLEAAASCKPIIATNVPGCREIVKDNVNGFLVPVHCPEQLAEKIVFLIKNPEIAQSMGTAGRRIVEENFLEEKVNSETIRVYEDLITA